MEILQQKGRLGGAAHKDKAAGWWREVDKTVKKSWIALAEFNILFHLMAFFFFCQKLHWFHQILNKKIREKFFHLRKTLSENVDVSLRSIFPSLFQAALQPLLMFE